MIWTILIAAALCLGAGVLAFFANQFAVHMNHRGYMGGTVFAAVLSVLLPAALFYSFGQSLVEPTFVFGTFIGMAGLGLVGAVAALIFTKPRAR